MTIITYNMHLNRLMIPNNKLLRILQNALYTPVLKLYANCNTFTLTKLHIYQLKFIHVVII